jgi:hypothetical protein
MSSGRFIVYADPVRNCIFGLLLLLAAPAHADVVLLLGESYGRFGSLTPTGHVAVYLTRVCADTPVLLRRCEPGETGVVISRYHKVAGLDWVAMPLIPFLYAVDRAAAVPEVADRAAVFTLRDGYRREHFADLIPDDAQGLAPRGHWVQLVGDVYDRKLNAFSVRTTPEQDDALIEHLNGRPNVERFNLLFRNCADFARDILDHYFPGALRRSFMADFGFTTPKQIAKSLVRYAERHPDLEFAAFVVPQIPGSRPNSRAARGVAESLVKTKKYLIPLTVVQPWVPTGLAAGYLMTGRFRLDDYAVHILEPLELEAYARQVSTSP